MTREPADITVIIPSFNRTHLALETLNSVLGQSRPVREIIIVANGDDKHAAFWHERAQGNVRVLRQPSLGVQAARNAGIRSAQSQWVALLDDDDVYLPDFIAAVMPAIEDGRADIVGTDHRKFRPTRVDRRTNFEAAPKGYWKEIRPEDCSREWSFVGQFPLHLLLKRVPLYPSTMVLRRDFALRIGGYDPAMEGVISEDLEFLIRALTYGKVSLVWRPLVRYRLHSGNNSANCEARAIGRWRIFEFARQSYPTLPESFRKALDRDLPRRRRKMFRLAFDIGDQELMDEIWPKLHPLHRTPDVMLLRLAAEIVHRRPAARRTAAGRSPQDVAIP